MEVCKNLRIKNCVNDNPVVQVKDGDDWLCCHNEDAEDDLHDVNELRKDPSGKTCAWKNPYLSHLQKGDVNYLDTESEF